MSEGDKGRLHHIARIPHRYDESVKPSRGRRLQRWLRLTGLLLGLAGLAFVLLRTREHAGEWSWEDWSVARGSALLGLALAYGLANLLLASAWQVLLARERVEVSRRWAIRTYGLSQLAKYLPGNVFHFLGRQAFGMADGLPAWSVARASAWELGLIIVAGLILGAGGGVWVFWGGYTLWSAVLGALLVSLLFALVWRRGGRLAGIALLLPAAFLLVSAATFVGVIGLVGAPGGPLLQSSGLFAATYILAWLAGILTPGAPAGIGVRELVLLGLLHGAVPEPDLVLAILMSRVVTVAGDAILYLSVILGIFNEPS